MDNDQLFEMLLKSTGEVGLMEGYLSWLMSELNREERVWTDKELAESIRVFLMRIEDEKI
jgi:hypothetical protein